MRQSFLPDLKQNRAVRLQSFIARTSVWTAILCIVALIALSVYDFTLRHGEGFHWGGGILIATGLLCLSTWTASFLGDIHQWREVKRQARFVFINGRNAVSAGVGLASILAGIYWAMDQTSGVGARFEGILSIYLGVVVVALGVTAFYTRFAPITNVTVLLREVARDLIEADEHVETWLVYPALCIGTYRYARDRLPVLGRPDDDFKDALRDHAKMIDGGTGSIRILTYPPEEWMPLFEAYAKQVGDLHPGEMNAEHPIQAAVHFAAEVITSTQGVFTKPGEKFVHRCISPEHMPQGVIVIGSVVYVLASFGLPQYRPGNGFIPLDASNGAGRRSDVEFVELIAFRRVDDELARSVCRHLRHVWNFARPASVKTKT